MYAFIVMVVACLERERTKGINDQYRAALDAAIKALNALKTYN